MEGQKQSYRKQSQVIFFALLVWWPESCTYYNVTIGEAAVISALRSEAGHILLIFCQIYSVL